MIRIEVNIDDDQLVEGLAALARQGEDASPIMRGLAGIMRSAAEDAFDLERDPVTGAPWPPLNAAYKKKRYEDGYTGKILSRTGRMQQTLSVRYGRDFALVGVSAPYAAAHQFGARTRAHIIRARFKKALSFYRAPPAQGRAGRMTARRCAPYFSSGRAIAHVFLFLKI